MRKDTAWELLGNEHKWSASVKRVHPRTLRRDKQTKLQKVTSAEVNDEFNPAVFLFLFSEISGRGGETGDEVQMELGHQGKIHKLYESGTQCQRPERPHRLQPPPQISRKKEVAEA